MRPARGQVSRSLVRPPCVRRRPPTRRAPGVRSRGPSRLGSAAERIHATSIPRAAAIDRLETARGVFGVVQDRPAWCSGRFRPTSAHKRSWPRHQERPSPAGLSIKRATRLEPETFGLGSRRSKRLSYLRVCSPPSGLDADASQGQAGFDLVPTWTPSVRLSSARRRPRSRRSPRRSGCGAVEHPAGRI